jgi:2-polyprenyl-6-methoxyphenol hydroxylase-like FAD-dependent oxidoreductase
MRLSGETIMAESTSVLVAGGGPVGLVLAMDLAQRGVKVTVVEQRAAKAPPSPKCNHVSARSMEYFRRLGIADLVRDAGLPHDHPHDVCFRTTVTGQELSRIPIPARGLRGKAKGQNIGPDTTWPTPEPPHRINQIFLEPLLQDSAAAIPGLALLNRTSLEDFEQDTEGVTATLKDLESGEIRPMRAQYLVGCDGGRSMVRRRIGAKMQGDPVVQRVQSTYIRAPGLHALLRHERSWMTLSMNPRRCGNTVAINGIDTFLVHNYFYAEETDFEAMDRDASLRAILGVGPDFQYEVLSNEDWIGRRLVADRMRDRRVFLAGDSAHIWVPYGGYGMNAGIADAISLSWLLAAHLQGWAPAGILDAYEAERLPITEQVSHFAMGHAFRAIRQRAGIPPEIEAEGPEGDACRARLGQEMYDLHVQQYCCGGLNFGYYYEGSPIIATDGQAPAYSMDKFEQSTVPGCRTPHLWLADGRSLYDSLGGGFTLLRFDADIDATPLLEAAQQRGVPMALLDVAVAERGPYREKLVLSRPDLHVAWRGDALPADPGALVDLIRGARPAAARRAA